MKDFKRCSNGHFFKKDLDSCPHCPQGSDTTKTQVSQGGGDFDKTQVFGNQGGGSNDETQAFGNSSDDKTQVFGSGPGGSNSTQVFPGASDPGHERDLDKTFIGGVTPSSEEGGAAVQSTPRAARKITGWLVSFTLDEMGIDYRIYEGNNTIGRANENTIIIKDDSTISSRHANILFKGGKFWIKDDMAANGTFINDVEIEIEKACSIKDGDNIRLGNTVFIFKTWY